MEQPASHESDLISKRAEIFRSKLIEDFHLLDSIDERGGTETPKYFSKDVSVPGRMRAMMQEGPNALVRFHAYSSGDKRSITHTERRLNRVKNKNSSRPPLDMWAHWVIVSSWFQNFMLILILSNSLVLGILGELEDVIGTDVSILRTILYVFDYCTLGVFILEILLKWLDNFPNFWRQGGNIFDFIVTLLSFLPEIMTLVTGNSNANSLAVIADNLRVFRILRSLKMVTRFRQVRLIALAVAKAFQAMVFITLLLMTFLYIFAIVGVMFFEKHSKSQNPELKYQSSFNSITNAMLTLFQLLTLDGWRDILDDLHIVSDGVFTTFYIILWICIGSFIFKNIFVGIMVNNFQSIRSDLFEDVREMVSAYETNAKLAKLNEELAKHDQQFHQNKGQDVDATGSNNEVIQSTWSSGQIATPGEDVKDKDVKKEPPKQVAEIKQYYEDPTVEEYENVVSQHMLHITQSGEEWQKTLVNNLDTISKSPIDTAWPRDTLFCYLLLMESLQENIEERQQLLNLANEALLQLHDN